jgi:hypothetical protein
VAREGLGMTRIRNQISASRLVSGNSHRSRRDRKFEGIVWPVRRHARGRSLLESDIITLLSDAVGCLTVTNVG